MAGGGVASRVCFPIELDAEAAAKERGLEGDAQDRAAAEIGRVAGAGMEKEYQGLIAWAAGAEGAQGRVLRPASFGPAGDAGGLPAGWGVVPVMLTVGDGGTVGAGLVLERGVLRGVSFPGGAAAERLAGLLSGAGGAGGAGGLAAEAGRIEGGLPGGGLVVFAEVVVPAGGGGAAFGVAGAGGGLVTVGGAGLAGALAARGVLPGVFGGGGGVVVTVLSGGGVPAGLAEEFGGGLGALLGAEVSVRHAPPLEAAGGAGPWPGPVQGSGKAGMVPSSGRDLDNVAALARVRLARYPAYGHARWRLGPGRAAEIIGRLMSGGGAVPSGSGRLADLIAQALVHGGPVVFRGGGSDEREEQEAERHEGRPGRLREPSPAVKQEPGSPGPSDRSLGALAREAERLIGIAFPESDARAVRSAVHEEVVGAGTAHELSELAGRAAWRALGPGAVPRTGKAPAARSERGLAEAARIVQRFERIPLSLDKSAGGGATADRIGQVHAFVERTGNRPAAEVLAVYLRERDRGTAPLEERWGGNGQARPGPAGDGGRAGTPAGVPGDSAALGKAAEGPGVPSGSEIDTAVGTVQRLSAVYLTLVAEAAAKATLLLANGPEAGPSRESGVWDAWDRLLRAAQASLDAAEERLLRLAGQVDVSAGPLADDADELEGVIPQEPGRDFEGPVADGRLFRRAQALLGAAPSVASAERDELISRVAGLLQEGRVEEARELAKREGPGLGFVREALPGGAEPGRNQGTSDARLKGLKVDDYEYTAELYKVDQSDRALEISDMVASVRSAIDEERRDSEYEEQPHTVKLSADELRRLDASWKAVERKLRKMIVAPKGARLVEEPLIPGKPVGKHEVFGAKSLVANYNNHTNLARFLLGWVEAKPGWREEKKLSRLIADDPVVSVVLDSVLLRFSRHLHWLLDQVVKDPGHRDAITRELTTGVLRDGKAATRYLTYFNRHSPQYEASGLPAELGFSVWEKPDSRGLLAILESPHEYPFPEKVAAVHDFVDYFTQVKNTAGAPYGLEPDNSRFVHTFAIDDQGKRTLGSDPNEKSRPASWIVGDDNEWTRSRHGLDESSPWTMLARRWQLPVWNAPSFTMARMLHYVETVHGGLLEKAGVARAMAAFWRLHYDHAFTPSHTFHEVFDIAQNFGVQYSLKAPYAGLRALKLEGLQADFERQFRSLEEALKEGTTADPGKARDYLRQAQWFGGVLRQLVAQPERDAVVLTKALQDAVSWIEDMSEAALPAPNVPEAGAAGEWQGRRRRPERLSGGVERLSGGVPREQRDSDLPRVPVNEFDEAWRWGRAVSAGWFAPLDDPLAPKQWAGLRDSAPFRRVQTSEADVRVGPASGLHGRLVSDVGRIRYDVRRFKVRERWVREFEVRIQIVPGEGGFSATPAEVAALQEAASRGVDQIVNRGYRLPGGDQLHVRLMFEPPAPVFAPPPARFSVEADPSDAGALQRMRAAAYPGLEALMTWGFRRSDGAAMHVEAEFGTQQGPGVRTQIMVAADDGIGERERAALERAVERWSGEVAGALGGSSAAGGLRARVWFDVVGRPVPPHMRVVAVGRGTRMDQARWEVGSSPEELAHEVLHLLGLPDEYVDESQALRGTASHIAVHEGDGSVMGLAAVGEPDSARLLPRHAWRIAAVAGGHADMAGLGLGPAGAGKPELPFIPGRWDLEEGPEPEIRLLHHLGSAAVLAGAGKEAERVLPLTSAAPGARPGDQGRRPGHGAVPSALQPGGAGRLAAAGQGEREEVLRLRGGASRWDGIVGGARRLGGRGQGASSAGGAGRGATGALGRRARAWRVVRGTVAAGLKRAAGVRGTIAAGLKRAAWGRRRGPARAAGWGAPARTVLIPERPSVAGLIREVRSVAVGPEFGVPAAGMAGGRLVVDFPRGVRKLEGAALAREEARFADPVRRLVDAGVSARVAGGPVPVLEVAGFSDGPGIGSPGRPQAAGEASGGERARVVRGLLRRLVVRDIGQRPEEWRLGAGLSGDAGAEWFAAELVPDAPRERAAGARAGEAGGPVIVSLSYAPSYGPAAGPALADADGPLALSVVPGAVAVGSGGLAAGDVRYSLIQDGEGVVRAVSFLDGAGTGRVRRFLSGEEGFAGADALGAEAREAGGVWRGGSGDAAGGPAVHSVSVFVDGVFADGRGEPAFRLAGTDGRPVVVDGGEFARLLVGTGSFPAAAGFSVTVLSGAWVAPEPARVLGEAPGSGAGVARVLGEALGAELERPVSVRQAEPRRRYLVPGTWLSVEEDLETGKRTLVLEGAERFAGAHERPAEAWLEVFRVLRGEGVRFDRVRDVVEGEDGGFRVIVVPARAWRVLGVSLGPLTVTGREAVWDGRAAVAAPPGQVVVAAMGHGQDEAFKLKALALWLAEDGARAEGGDLSKVAAVWYRREGRQREEAAQPGRFTEGELSRVGPGLARLISAGKLSAPSGELVPSAELLAEGSPEYQPVADLIARAREYAGVAGLRPELVERMVRALSRPGAAPAVNYGQVHVFTPEPAPRPDRPDPDFELVEQVIAELRALGSAARPSDEEVFRVRDDLDGNLATGADVHAPALIIALRLAGYGQVVGADDETARGEGRVGRPVENVRGGLDKPLPGLPVGPDARQVARVMAALPGSSGGGPGHVVDALTDPPRWTPDAVEGQLARILPDVGEGQDCAVRLEQAARVFYPVPAVSRDDAVVGRVQPEAVLAAWVGGTWRPAAGALDAVIRRVRGLGPGATAFFLSSPPDLSGLAGPVNIRHAFALHYAADGKLYWVETQKAPGERLGRLGSSDMPSLPIGAQVIVVNPFGRAVSDPFGDITRASRHGDAQLAPPIHARPGAMRRLAARPDAAVSAGSASREGQLAPASFGPPPHGTVQDQDIAEEWAELSKLPKRRSAKLRDVDEAVEAFARDGGIESINRVDDAIDTWIRGKPRGTKRIKAVNVLRQRMLEATRRETAKRETAKRETAKRETDRRVREITAALSAAESKALKSEAKPKRQDFSLLGPDLFGVRKGVPAPGFLAGIQQEDLKTTQLRSFFRSLDLSRSSPRVDRLREDGAIWEAEFDKSQRCWTKGSPYVEYDLSELPENLNMPKIFHAIWLGSAFDDRSEKMKGLQENLIQLRQLAPQDMEVVLWTDIPRLLFDDVRAGIELRSAAEYGAVADAGGAQRMLEFAERTGVILLSVEEVFHDGDPMGSAALYKQEMAKLLPEGYAQASDILRWEILYRFGGIYTDQDNLILKAGSQLDTEIAEIFKVAGAAGHRFADDERRRLNNSAIMAARSHPLSRVMLDLIAENYKFDQFDLYDEGPTPNTPEALAREAAAWTKEDASLWRRSILLRTGPEALESLDVHNALPDLNGILRMGGAHSWRPPASFQAWRPYRSVADEDFVVQRVVATLVRGLYNRRGDLNLAAVAPVVLGLRDPFAAWRAIIEFVMNHPQLARRVRTVTDRILAENGVGGAQLVLLDLPPEAYQRLGIEPLWDTLWAPGQLWLGELMRPIDRERGAAAASATAQAAPTGSGQAGRRDRKGKEREQRESWRPGRPGPAGLVAGRSSIEAEFDHLLSVDGRIDFSGQPITGERLAGEGNIAFEIVAEDKRFGLGVDDKFYNGEGATVTGVKTGEFSGVMPELMLKPTGVLFDENPAGRDVADKGYRDWERALKNLTGEMGAPPTVLLGEVLPPGHDWRLTSAGERALVAPPSIGGWEGAYAQHNFGLPVWEIFEWLEHVYENTSDETTKVHLRDGLDLGQEMAWEYVKSRRVVGVSRHDLKTRRDAYSLAGIVALRYTGAAAIALYHIASPYGDYQIKDGAAVLVRHDPAVVIGAADSLVQEFISTSMDSVLERFETRFRSRMPDFDQEFRQIWGGEGEVSVLRPVRRLLVENGRNIAINNYRRSLNALPPEEYLRGNLRQGDVFPMTVLAALDETLLGRKLVVVEARKYGERPASTDVVLHQHGELSDVLRGIDRRWIDYELAETEDLRPVLDVPPGSTEISDPGRDTLRQLADRLATDIVTRRLSQVPVPEIVITGISAQNVRRVLDELVREGISALSLDVRTLAGLDSPRAVEEVLRHLLPENSVGEGSGPQVIVEFRPRRREKDMAHQPRADMHLVSRVRSTLMEDYPDLAAAQLVTTTRIWETFLRVEGGPGVPKEGEPFVEYLAGTIAAEAKPVGQVGRVAAPAGRGPRRAGGVPLPEGQSHAGPSRAPVPPAPAGPGSAGARVVTDPSRYQAYLRKLRHGQIHHRAYVRKLSDGQISRIAFDISGAIDARTKGQVDVTVRLDIVRANGAPADAVAKLRGQLSRAVSNHLQNYALPDGRRFSIVIEDPEGLGVHASVEAAAAGSGVRGRQWAYDAGPLELAAAIAKELVGLRVTGKPASGDLLQKSDLDLLQSLITPPEDVRDRRGWVPAGPDRADEALRLARAEIAPSLAPYAARREDVFWGDASLERYEREGVDRKLSQNAVAWRREHYEAGVRRTLGAVDAARLNLGPGITDDHVRQVLAREGNDQWPELKYYLQPGDLSKPKDRNAPRDEWRRLKVRSRVFAFHEPTIPVDDWRFAAIGRAVDLVEGAGYDVSGQITFYLPKYQQTIAVVKGKDGVVRAARENSNSFFGRAYGDSIFLRPRGSSPSNRSMFYSQLQDREAAAVVHELAHALAFAHNPALAADLTRAKLHPEWRKRLAGVSEYARKNPVEALAELFVKKVFGFPLEKWEEELLAALGAPQPTRPPSAEHRNPHVSAHFTDVMKALQEEMKKAVDPGLVERMSARLNAGERRMTASIVAARIAQLAVAEARDGQRVGPGAFGPLGGKSTAVSILGPSGSKGATGPKASFHLELSLSGRRPDSRGTQPAPRRVRIELDRVAVQRPDVKSQAIEDLASKITKEFRQLHTGTVLPTGVGPLVGVPPGLDSQIEEVVTRAAAKVVAKLHRTVLLQVGSRNAISLCDPSGSG